MKTKRSLLVWMYVIAAGWFLAVAHAKGESPNYAAQVRAQETKFRTPDDVLDLVPLLGEIPRTFLFGDGYTMKLSADQLRIDHMGLRSKSKGAQRTCMIGLSYTTPVAGFFTSRIDVPLFNSPTVNFADWSVSSFGDYVVYLSRLPANRASLRLAISARF
jgi:hypothetical protein